jgi:predicted DNA-binding ribbon-helix-helix protein
MGQESGRLHPSYAPVRKRSIAIAGTRTSVSLEDAFWRSLRAIAYAERMNTNALVAEIVEKSGTAGVSSAIRQFVLSYCQHRTLGDAKTAPRSGRTASVPE